MVATIRPEGTMRPDAEVLADVLPSDTLGPTGRPVGELRDELYRIPDLANWGHVAGVWIQSVGFIALAVWWDHPVGWIATFLLMGRAFARFSIQGHEAAHRLLFSNRKLNDRVGAWLVSYPAFLPLEVYRRGHMAHHKEEFGPNEPDRALYAGYPITRASWRRKLRRDANGNSGWKNLKSLLLALRSERGRAVATKILGWQVVLFAGFWLAFDRWWIYPVLWLAPWMTVWRVLNRLRSVAEHGGLDASPDRRLTTHHVRQSLSARFWMVPFNTGWHLAHHVDIGVPFSKLPRLQSELERSGYVQPGLEWPNYRSLWRHASSRPE